MQSGIVWWVLLLFLWRWCRWRFVAAMVFVGGEEGGVVRECVCVRASINQLYIPR